MNHSSTHPSKSPDSSLSNPGSEPGGDRAERPPSRRRAKISFHMMFSAVVFIVVMMSVAVILLGCSKTAPVVSDSQPELPATRPQPSQAASSPVVSPEAAAERRKTTDAKCREFIQWQLGMLFYKSGPKFEKPTFIEDRKGTWMTLPFTIISKQNKTDRSVAFCRLSATGEFDSLTGTDEKDSPEWWSPEKQTTQEAAEARERRERVYLFPDIPAKYVSLLKKAMELAKQNSQCIRVTDADYLPTDVHGRRTVAPFLVTCIVSNPRVPTHPYANYNYTQEQIEKGIAKPYSTLGDL